MFTLTLLAVFFSLVAYGDWRQGYRPWHRRPCEIQPAESGDRGGHV